MLANPPGRQVMLSKSRSARPVTPERPGNRLHSGSAAADGEAPSCHHLVSLICSFGWETRQCQTTAWKASVCGVMRAASTVGITIT
jgi:hypothetical protein